jgi:HEAT repeat protein
MSSGTLIRRSALVFALGAFLAAAQPNVAAWEVLKRGMAESNPDKRKQAVLAMGTIGPAPEVIELMNEALRDKDVTVRQTAAAEIADAQLRQCIPNLKAALDDTGEVAVQAAKALWDMGDHESARPVFDEVITRELKDTSGFFEGALRDAKSKLRDPKKLARMGAMEASGALLGPFSMGINVASDMMKDSGAPTRALALVTLSKDCAPRGAQLMDWALTNDKNNLVRAAAAKALGRCGNLTTVDKLMRLLAESSDAVRYMAAASVVRLSIPQAQTSRRETTQPAGAQASQATQPLETARPVTAQPSETGQPSPASQPAEPPTTTQPPPPSQPVPPAPQPPPTTTAPPQAPPPLSLADHGHLH